MKRQAQKVLPPNKSCLSELIESVSTESQPVQKKFIIAGLGNPGDSYCETRHNIGFKIIDAVSKTYKIPMQHHLSGALVGMGKIKDENVILVKPLSFMNLSGTPVYQLAQGFGLSCNDMLIVHDDMDLSFGRLKIKEKGGSGGHNGIQSLIDAFGGGDFTRLRIGIGRPETGINAVNHVLTSFNQFEKELLDQFISRALDAVVTVLCNGAKEGMNRFNQAEITITSQTTDGGKEWIT